MSLAHFRFSTAILKRLGEELNIGVDQGILELVKNAYDADARECTVELIDVDQPGGTIRVTDDGDGMTERAIREGWLVLGTSIKSPKKPTRLGRTPIGSKGLGRLAALRLGKKAGLRSRPFEKSKVEYSLQIEWEEFDRAPVVEEIELNLEALTCPDKVDNGTEISIQDLHDKIGRLDVRRLARGMLMLADPFGDNPAGFQPLLKAKAFRDLERLVQRRYFDEAEFHLQASIDSEGWASAKVLDYHGATLFEAKHEELRQKPRNQSYTLPPVSFDLWVFILNRETFLTRSATIGEVRKWLQEFGGVHLYIHGIRVAPYGNPGNDWLEMNLMRVRSPELRPSTNTSIGRIALNDSEGMFVEKTDRTGLIENEALLELKQFAQDSLKWMARVRIRERDRRRVEVRVATSEDVQRKRDSVAQSIKTLPEPQQRRVQQVFSKYDKAREKEAEALRREVQLYRTLSTVGIVAAVFGHEIRQPIDIIHKNANQVKRRGQRLLGTDYEGELGGPVKRILQQAATMDGFRELTVGFIEKGKRRNRRVEIHDIVRRMMKAFEAVFKERDVKPTPQLASGEPYLRGSEAALESILANLFVNSLKAFETAPPGPRHIVVRTTRENGVLKLRVLDNGPGIEDIPLADIWTPGETSYPKGTGLGLTIVRDSVRDLGGDVSAVAHGELGGAEMIIELPILGE